LRVRPDIAIKAFIWETLGILLLIAVGLLFFGNLKLITTLTLVFYGIRVVMLYFYEFFWVKVGHAMVKTLLNRLSRIKQFLKRNPKSELMRRLKTNNITIFNEERVLEYIDRAGERFLFLLREIVHSLLDNGIPVRITIGHNYYCVPAVVVIGVTRNANEVKLINRQKYKAEKLMRQVNGLILVEWAYR